MPESPTAFIDTDDGLSRAVRSMANSDWLAIDTEFQRESTYYSVLCLVQVSDGQQAWAFDALKLDLAPLWELFMDPERIKVLHSADQDYEIFVQLIGHAPRPLFDTQVAATLLGIGDQIGYAGLVDKRLGITVDKSLSRTDWTRRPLSGAAIEYALDDVRHLSRIYPSLREELNLMQRMSWMNEDCEALSDEARYTPTPETAWTRVKGLGRLSAPQQHIAARVARWREQVAIASNRPRRWILKDDAVLAIAERQPRSESELETLGIGKAGGSVRAGLLAIIEQDLYTHSDEPALASAERPDAKTKSQLAKLSKYCLELAETLGVPASYLAPRAEIARLQELGADAPIRLLRGWRRNAAGEALLELRNTLKA